MTHFPHNEICLLLKAGQSNYRKLCTNMRKNYKSSLKLLMRLNVNNLKFGSGNAYPKPDLDYYWTDLGTLNLIVFFFFQT